MYTLTKLSLATTIIAGVTFIAKQLGILELKYVIIIAIILSSIQAIFIGMSIAILVRKYRKTCGVRIVRYQFNDRFVRGNDYMIPEHVSVTNPRKSALFKILLEIKYAGEPPEIIISKNNLASAASDIKNHIINVNSGVVEDSNLIFDADVIVKPGEEINLHISKDALIKYFFLGETYIP
jgi:hypothetical protein